VGIWTVDAQAGVIVDAQAEEEDLVRNDAAITGVMMLGLDCE